MDRYQCLELFYGHWGICCCPPPITGASVTTPSWGALDAPRDAPDDAKVSFFDNLLKKLDSSSSFQKKYLVFHT